MFDIPQAPLAVERDAQRVARLRRGDVPIHEPGLEPMVQAHFTSLAPLALGADIDAALRGNSGPLQPLLALAIACERSDGEHLRDAAERCGIPPEQASQCHMQALSWAIQIQD